MLWRSCTGSGWRDVPECYGAWQAICSRFNGWAKTGVFQGVTR
ncbi:transposase [Streptomyces sp. NPDC087538]